MIRRPCLCPITHDENRIERISRLAQRGGATTMRRFNSARSPRGNDV